MYKQSKAIGTDITLAGDLCPLVSTFCSASVAQSNSRSTAEQEVAGSIPTGPGNILSLCLSCNIFYGQFPLPLIQERQLSVSGERLCARTS